MMMKVFLISTGLLALGLGTWFYFGTKSPKNVKDRNAFGDTFGPGGPGGVYQRREIFTDLNGDVVINRCCNEMCFMRQIITRDGYGTFSDMKKWQNGKSLSRHSQMRNNVISERKKITDSQKAHKTINLDKYKEMKTCTECGFRKLCGWCRQNGIRCRMCLPGYSILRQRQKAPIKMGDSLFTTFAEGKSFKQIVSILLEDKNIRRLKDCEVFGLLLPSGINGDNESDTGTTDRRMSQKRDDFFRLCMEDPEKRAMIKPQDLEKMKKIVPEPFALHQKEWIKLGVTTQMGSNEIRFGLLSTPSEDENKH